METNTSSSILNRKLRIRQLVDHIDDEDNYYDCIDDSNGPLIIDEEEDKEERNDGDDCRLVIVDSYSLIEFKEEPLCSSETDDTASPTTTTTTTDTPEVMLIEDSNQSASKITKTDTSRVIRIEDSDVSARRVDKNQIGSIKRSYPAILKRKVSIQLETTSDSSFPSKLQSIQEPEPALIHAEKRRRNNEASKQSRDRKRQREMQKDINYESLRNENYLLRCELSRLYEYFNRQRASEELKKSKIKYIKINTFKVRDALLRCLLNTKMNDDAQIEIYRLHEDGDVDNNDGVVMN